MQFGNTSEFDMQTYILLDDNPQKLVKAEEDIKKPTIYSILKNNYLFLRLMSYLQKKEVFTAALLVNQQISKFTKSIDFWVNIYLLFYDRIVDTPETQSKQYLNRLGCLLYDAIKADFFELLLDPHYQRSWNLEIFFALDAPLISSLILEKTQLLLKLTYLAEAKEKKKV